MKKTLKFLFVFFMLFICVISVDAQSVSCIYENKYEYEDADGRKSKERYELNFNDNDSKTIYLYKFGAKTEKKHTLFFEYDGVCPEIIYYGCGVSGHDYCGLYDSHPSVYNDEEVYYLIDRNVSHVYCGSEQTGRVTHIPKKIPELTSSSFTTIQVLVPIILVIFGTLDLFKGVTAGKEDEIKKGQQMFIKRLGVAVIIFFGVIIVKFFISIVADTNQTNIIDCIDCFISNDCKEDLSL